MSVSCADLRHYLDSRSAHVRRIEWLRGRYYRVTQLARPGRVFAGHLPVVIAHNRRDRAAAGSLSMAIEADWPCVPGWYRQVYEDVLGCAPEIVIVDLRRANRCGCLGHRHPVVREKPFTEPHECLGGQAAGELDIAWQRVERWPALPLEEMAFDARFFEGSRLQEFRARQFRLRLLSVLLHETNHLAFPHEPEESVRDRSLGFYREALRSYVEETCATLSFTIDRSFSRLE